MTHLLTHRAYLKSSKSLDYMQRYGVTKDALHSVFAFNEFE